MIPFSQTAEAWADWMIRGLVDGTWVCALALALWLPVRKRAPTQLGYGLFLLVLLKLVFPFEFTVPHWFTQWLPSGLLNEPWLPAARVTAQPVPIFADATPVAASTWSTEAILFIAWAVIAGICLCRLAWVQARTAELARRSRPIGAGELPVDFAALQRLAGLRSPVRFLACDRIHSPAAGGLFRPYVLLPMELCRAMPREPLSWVLLHELAHLRRGDLWVSLLQRVVQVVFFFHPAVWLANWIVDEQREFACDEFALRVSKAPRRECGEGFLSIVEWSQQHPQDAVATLGMFDSKSVIRRRLMRILNGRGAERRLGARLCTAFVVLTGLLVLPTPKLEAASPQDPERTKEIREQIRELEALKQKLEKKLRAAERARFAGRKERADDSRWRSEARRTDRRRFDSDRRRADSDRWRADRPGRDSSDRSDARKRYDGAKARYESKADQLLRKRYDEAKARYDSEAESDPRRRYVERRYERKSEAQPRARYDERRYDRNPEPESRARYEGAKRRYDRAAPEPRTRNDGARRRYDRTPKSDDARPQRDQVRGVGRGRDGRVLPGRVVDDEGETLPGVRVRVERTVTETAPTPTGVGFVRRARAPRSVGFVETVPEPSRAGTVTRTRSNRGGSAGRRSRTEESTRSTRTRRTGGGVRSGREPSRGVYQEGERRGAGRTGVNSRSSSRRRGVYTEPLRAVGVQPVREVTVEEVSLPVGVRTVVPVPTEIEEVAPPVDVSAVVPVRLIEIEEVALPVGVSTIVHVPTEIEGVPIVDVSKVLPPEAAILIELVPVIKTGSIEIDTAIKYVPKSRVIEVSVPAWKPRQKSKRRELH